MVDALDSFVQDRTSRINLHRKEGNDVLVKHFRAELAVLGRDVNDITDVPKVTSAPNLPPALVPLKTTETKVAPVVVPSESNQSDESKFNDAVKFLADKNIPGSGQNWTQKDFQEFSKNIIGNKLLSEAAGIVGSDKNKDFFNKVDGKGGDGVIGNNDLKTYTTAKKGDVKFGYEVGPSTEKLPTTDLPVPQTLKETNEYQNYKKLKEAEDKAKEIMDKTPQVAGRGGPSKKWVDAKENYENAKKSTETAKNELLGSPAVKELKEYKELEKAKEDERKAREAYDKAPRAARGGPSITSNEALKAYDEAKKTTAAKQDALDKILDL